MSFGCSSKELEKFQNRILNTQSGRLKMFLKNDPQTLPKK